jgi:hypothetical protein
MVLEAAVLPTPSFIRLNLPDQIKGEKAASKYDQDDGSELPDLPEWSGNNHFGSEHSRTFAP